jgi:NDP-sugar pyrophosphorylase family protein
LTVQCAVLAGGLATRMRPATENVPKLLLEVAGAPFADWQLSWLAAQGVQQVVLCIGYLGEQIRAYVGDGARWGVEVSYSDEGKDRRGTAGALRLAADQSLLAEAFLVLYGDSYLDVDVGAVWDTFARSGKPALMTVFRNDDRWDRSNTRLEPDGTAYYDKRVPDPATAGLTHIDYGLLALRRAVIESAVPEGGRGDLADIQHDLSSRSDLAAFEATNRFYEIGTPEGLRDLEARLRSASVRIPPE